MKKVCITLLLGPVLALTNANLLAQELYTAKGYWTELNKESYTALLDRQNSGDTLTTYEKYYLEDYESYLKSYYDRMTDEEKARFAAMKLQWDLEASSLLDGDATDFDLRTRDRLVNGIYGFYYGLSLSIIISPDEAGASIGLPLVTAGLWQLGPVINRKKYENITPATIRAGNTGKLLGLGYGISAGLAVAGDDTNSGSWIFGLSTVGSIALGEFAFQRQKRYNLTEGYVEIVRIYGFLGPAVTGLTAASFSPNSRAIGASLLLGGAGGLLIGDYVARQYDIHPGDADVISSFFWISGGLGFAFAGSAFDGISGSGTLMIPAASFVAGTLYAQKSVRGINFTKKQGSTIKLASGGAALIGLGFAAMFQADQPFLIIGLPSAFALVTHQLLVNSYKKRILENRFNIGRKQTGRAQFSMQVSPENYLLNRSLSEATVAKNPSLSYPIVRLKLKF
jgi:hypothetical protein